MSSTLRERWVNTMTVTEIDKSKLTTEFNKWVSSVEGDGDAKVSNEMKLYLINAFPHMLEEAFPKKKSFGERLREAREKAKQEADEKKKQEGSY